MANKFFDKGIEAFLEGSIAALTDTIKASLISSATYTPNYATDQFYNIIAGGAIIAAGVALGTKTGSAGTLSAANTVWTAVSGSQAAYIALYKDTGLSSTSPLIGLIDTATGLPVTPNGGDITAAWASGQVFTLFQGLPQGEPGLIRQLWEWFNEGLRIPARRDASGLWLPTPAILTA